MAGSAGRCKPGLTADWGVHRWPREGGEIPSQGALQGDSSTSLQARHPGVPSFGHMCDLSSPLPRPDPETAVAQLVSSGKETISLSL